MVASHDKDLFDCFSSTKVGILCDKEENDTVQVSQFCLHSA